MNIGERDFIISGMTLKLKGIDPTKSVGKLIQLRANSIIYRIDDLQIMGIKSLNS